MNNIMLIGSRALAIRNKDLLTHKPVDFDFIGSREGIDNWVSKNKDILFPAKDYYILDGKKYIIEGNTPCEFEIAEEGSSGQLLLDIVKNDKETIFSDFGMIPNLDILFLLKSSHKYLKNSPFFYKTAVSYHILKNAGCFIRPEYKDILKLREKETYKNKTPRLKDVTKDAFFRDSIQYIVDHDSIHESIKTFDKPAYEYYKKPGSEVECSKELFDACSEEIKIAGVREEAQTLFIERSYLPFPGSMKPKQGFLFSLAKVCSSITSGWFREYGYENIFKVIDSYNDDFIDRFEEGRKNGTVKPYNGITGNIYND